MRNILTKQEPDDAYKTNLHELPKKKKKLSLELPYAYGK